MHVLVVDDEPMVREVVMRYLERDGFVATAAATGDEALKKFDQVAPDLVVLDLMLPGISGLDILQRIRATSDTPVILLTARAEEADRILGLELGADDYVVKPFSPRELSARVKSVLRRSTNTAEPAQERLEYETLVVDPTSREVFLASEPVNLTAREFDVLYFLASSPRQVFSRAQLLDQVWDSSPEWQDPSTVTVHIRRIRNKIESDPDNPKHLITVRGVGYRFAP